MSAGATTGVRKTKSRRAKRNKAKKVQLAQEKKLQLIDSKAKKNSNKVTKTDNKVTKTDNKVTKTDDKVKKDVKEVTKEKEYKDKRLRKPRSEKKLKKREQKQAFTDKALEYLEKWSNDRSSWKFNKNAQMLLIKKCCQAHVIPDDKFATFMKYAASLQTDGAKQLLKDVCIKMKEEHKEDKTIEYKRAKKILKSLK